MMSKRILVLGIGNILWADEGFGVRCVEALNAGWQFPPQVTLMDGGTQGLYLLPYVQEADCLLVFDAVDYGDEPGKLRDVIETQMQPALKIALDWLEWWGAPASVRQGLADGITDPALAIDVYEGERPPADQAYRLGDARFLNLETV